MTNEKMVVELMEEAETAEEPGSFDRRQVIHSASDTFPVDIEVTSLESAGYVYVYDTQTADRSVVNRNMLEQQLQKLRPDKTRYFTTVKPEFEPEQGKLKCLLHPDDPERSLYDSWGFALCPKANLTSQYQVTRHVQVRHRMEWQTIQDDREEERQFQRSLIELAINGRATTQATEATGTARTVNDGPAMVPTHSDCGCGQRIRTPYLNQHRRGKKHLRWEKRHGSQHS
jgi:hypothetical protein